MSHSEHTSWRGPLPMLQKQCEAPTKNPAVGPAAAAQAVCLAARLACWTGPHPVFQGLVRQDNRACRCTPGCDAGGRLRRRYASQRNRSAERGAKPLPSGTGIA